MLDIRSFALNALANSPNAKNNPNFSYYIQAIQNNDSANGEKIAENLCKTYGLSKDDAIAKAKRFFGLR